MLDEALGNPGISVLGPAEDWEFDARGNLSV
jgi:hypothetical protein